MNVERQEYDFLIYIFRLLSLFGQDLANGHGAFPGPGCFILAMDPWFTFAWLAYRLIYTDWVVGSNKLQWLLGTSWKEWWGFIGLLHVSFVGCDLSSYLNLCKIGTCDPCIMVQEAFFFGLIHDQEGREAAFQYSPETFHSYQDSGQTARQSGEAWHTCFCAACSLLSQNPSRSDPGKCRTRLWQKCLGVGGWRNLKLFVTKKSDLPIWGQSPSPLGEFRKRKIDDALQRLKMKRLATAAVARFTVVANVYINTNKELIRAMSDKCLVGPWPICSPRHEALENNWSVFVSRLSKGASVIH